MPAKTNLSFSELNAIAPGMCTYDSGTSDILISAKALTGQSYSALTDEKALGVYKRMLDVGKLAQDAANVGLTEGEILDTFNANALAVNELTNKVELRSSQDFVLDLADASVVGQNI